MRTIAASHGASVAQVALAWLLARQCVTSVIIGASKLHQLEDNLGSVNVKLTAAELGELDGATPLPAVYPNWFNDNLADRPLIEALQSTSRADRAG